MIISLFAAAIIFGFCCLLQSLSKDIPYRSVVFFGCLSMAFVMLALCIAIGGIC